MARIMKIGVLGPLLPVLGQISEIGKAPQPWAGKYFDGSTPVAGHPAGNGTLGRPWKVNI